MSVLHISLTSSKAKDISQLLANDTARRIMDAISEESKSESELAKTLSLPLSTVHYNITKLTDAGLVHSEEYTYSEKGKEIRHYKLISEHVVITTKPLASIASLLTGLGLTLGVAALFFVNDKLFGTQAPVIESYAQDAPQTMMALKAAPEAMAMTAPVQTAAHPTVWPWILLGAGLVAVGVLAYAAYERYIR